MLPRFHFSIERWRKNTDYGVWVSNLGRVRLVKNKQELEPRVDQSGYCVVFTDRGVCRVHKLVALTWLGEKPNEYFTIDHISTNKRDNSVKNLRWVKQVVNLDHSNFSSISDNLIKMETETPVKVVQSIVKSATEAATATVNNKGDEKIIAALTEPSETITKRVTAFRKYFLNNRIVIVCDGKEISTFHDLYKIKGTSALQATNDDFLNRMLMSTRSNKEYCGHKWQIKVNNNA